MVVRPGSVRNSLSVPFRRSFWAQLVGPYCRLRRRARWPSSAAAHVFRSPDGTNEVHGGSTLESILASIYPWARRMALVLCRDPHEADDLVQEAFVQTIRRTPSPLTPEALRAWLRPVIFRLYLHHRRRLLREARTIFLLRHDRLPRSSFSEPTEAVLDALSQLSSRQRACIVLHYLEDLPESEIGKILGIRNGTVKAHLAQARERLRQALRSGSG